MKYIKKIIPFNVDNRGTISHLVQDEVVIRGILFLTCNKGATRANHYHKMDTHYSYIVSGLMEYTWKDLHKPRAKKHSIIVSAGEMVITPPMIAHSMRFLEKSIFIAMTTKPRDRKDYENDTVKITLL